MRVMQQIAMRIRDIMAPFDKCAYRDPTTEVPSTVRHGEHVARMLHDVLSPDPLHGKGGGGAQGWNASYEALYIMQGLHTYVLHVAGLIDALWPVAQALWNKEFVAAVDSAKDELGRMQAWAKQQIGVRSPQTL